MHLFLQQLVNGIALGSIYSLVALGLTLVYGVLKIPNFAHGALYMVGAYITFFMATLYGIPYLPAIGISAIAVGLLGVVMERIVFRPLAGAPHVNMMIAALGVLLFLESLVLVVWGAEFRQLPTPFEDTVELGAIVVTEQRLLVIVAAVVAMLALFYFLKRTTTGATIEAMAQDPEGALLVGINTRRVAMLTFAISTGLAAIAASLIAPLNLVFPTMGETVNLKAFAIIILGGMGSVPGAIVGGFILALAEVMGGTYISTAFADLIGFGLLVLVLAIRPTGLFSQGA